MWILNCSNRMNPSWDNGGDGCRDVALQLDVELQFLIYKQNWKFKALKMCVVCSNGLTETKDGSRVQNTYKLTTLLHSMYPEPAKVFRNISRQVNIEMSLESFIIKHWYNWFKKLPLGPNSSISAVVYRFSACKEL